MTGRKRVAEKDCEDAVPCKRAANRSRSKSECKTPLPPAMSRFRTRSECKADTHDALVYDDPAALLLFSLKQDGHLIHKMERRPDGDLHRFDKYGVRSSVLRFLYGRNA